MNTTDWLFEIYPSFSADIAMSLISQFILEEACLSLLYNYEYSFPYVYQSHKIKFQP